MRRRRLLGRTPRCARNSGQASMANGKVAFVSGASFVTGEAVAVDGGTTAR